MQETPQNTNTTTMVAKCKSILVGLCKVIQKDRCLLGVMGFDCPTKGFIYCVLLNNRDGIGLFGR